MQSCLHGAGRNAGSAVGLPHTICLGVESCMHPARHEQLPPGLYRHAAGATIEDGLHFASLARVPTCQLPPPPFLLHQLWLHAPISDCMPELPAKRCGGQPFGLSIGPAHHMALSGHSHLLHLLRAYLHSQAKRPIITCSRVCQRWSALCSNFFLVVLKTRCPSQKSDATCRHIQSLVGSLTVNTTLSCIGPA